MNRIESRMNKSKEKEVYLSDCNFHFDFWNKRATRIFFGKVFFSFKTSWFFKKKFEIFKTYNFI